MTSLYNPQKGRFFRVKVGFSHNFGGEAAIVCSVRNRTAH